MNSDEFKTALSQFATGICVVTTKTSDGKPYGITINAFSSLSLEPPLVLFCLVKHARMYPFMRKTQHYAIHILSEEQQHLSAHFAKSGQGGMFENIDHHLHENGVPLLENSLATLMCEKHASYDGGDHTIFVGRVLETKTTQGNPLVYHNRGYQTLG